MNESTWEETWKAYSSVEKNKAVEWVTGQYYVAKYSWYNHLDYCGYGIMVSKAYGIEKYL